MDIHFAQTHPDDLPTVLRFLKEAALWLRERGIDYWQDWIDPPPLFRHWIQEGFDRDEFYLVYQDAEAIGCFRLQWQDELFWGHRMDKAGYIHSFTISRKWAGQRKGEQVLAVIEAYCRAQGKDFLRLDCGKAIQGLRQYYECYGFRQVGETTVMGEGLILYEKALSR
ncbi:MAG TPA: GNAT family N-acetyltransferase [Anaerolineae bacterium]|nr:GNAT family N-acetyltransferase [Anaerolineae bacterium]